MGDQAPERIWLDRFDGTVETDPYWPATNPHAYDAYIRADRARLSGEMQERLLRWENDESFWSHDRDYMLRDLATELRAMGVMDE